MSSLFAKYKTVIIVFIVIIIAFIAYSFFGPKPSQQSGNALLQQIAATSGGSAADGPGTVFVNQLLAIQNIHFNTEIFSDPAYQSLIDFSRPLIPQPIGRPNPFAPLNGSDATIASTTDGTSAGFVNTSDTTATATTTVKKTTTTKTTTK